VKLSTVEKATGVVAGVTLFLAGLYAFLYAAMWLIFESGRVMTLMGWYGLLIPAALLATPMLALKWALSKRKKDAKLRQSEHPKYVMASISARAEIGCFQRGIRNNKRNIGCRNERIGA